ncbi:DCC1-like thiol-disulfide oxidoreductase family protein [Lipingzhangella sp. LS1_29]|uniref:DCC1-like thiol-disulfide oxidoreductase family protein n=1 Tax=Lipingzhangella rawalii TaxID=2055835 RepID=A0ABU2H7M6_9ACTN|nr:DCC1-like thiol-disulfide oxidoreductase family protein [Lipingzhangella rawalii]MDS1271312.1 DCC1-like thiol-disulfide oxidoreductase family protein [Lipingzhangella rawalii]
MTHPAVVLYDGECAFCTAAAELGRCHVTYVPPQARMRSSPPPEVFPGVVWLPWQGASSAVAAHLRERARHEVLVVSADGRRVWGGSEAVAALLLNSPRRRWWPVGSLLRGPGTRRLARALYRWVARNRDRFPMPVTGARCRDTLQARGALVGEAAGRT